MSETTYRALRLLSLLQARPVWSGGELAERLGVTTRTVRRDVDRLRELGYPVEAAHGAAGGYRLGSGRVLPPLLLDDDEAVAVAVSLRLAAGGTVAGASEAALRALTKLDQVMPPRLRGEVRAIQAATDTLAAGGVSVDGDLLLTLARACRDRLQVRFDYQDRAGTPTSRRTEPYRLVATGRRWYLMAFDLDRDAWRSFRLDRMASAAATTFRFTPRDHEDPVAFIQRSVTSSPYAWTAKVRILAPVDVVRDRVSPGSASVEPHDEGSCLLTAGSHSLSLLAMHLAVLGFPFEVIEPPELRQEVAALARRLSASVSS